MHETLAVLFYMARNQDAKIIVENVKRGITPNSFFAEIAITRNILEGMK
jgi:hypothetical protein